MEERRELQAFLEVHGGYPEWLVVTWLGNDDIEYCPDAQANYTICEIRSGSHPVAPDTSFFLARSIDDETTRNWIRSGRPLLD